MHKIGRNIKVLPSGKELQATAERGRLSLSHGQTSLLVIVQYKMISPESYIHTDNNMGSAGCIYRLYTHVYKYVTITIKEKGGFQPGMGVEVLKLSNYYEDRDQLITSLRLA